MEFEKKFVFDEKYVEYLTVLSIENIKKGSKLIVLIVADLAVLASGILNGINGSWGSMALAGVLILFQILYVKFLLPASVKKGNAGQMGKEMALRFSEEKVAFDFPGGTSDIRWNLIDALVEREAFAALRLSNGRQFLVMEKALLSEEELAWIRERIERKNETPAVPAAPVTGDKYDI